MKPNLLITGSSGFVGKYFVKNNTEFTITEIDLITTEVNEIDFKRIDSVLHLAALVHQMKGAPEDEYFRINCDLTLKVAKKAKAQGVKHFVFMSTAKVYGESTTGKLPWNENSDCNPMDAYGKSKFEAEKQLLNLEDADFKIAIVRSPVVYGAEVKANMLNLLKLIDNVPILPFKTTNNMRSFVYIGNLVALLKHVLILRASGIYIAGDSAPLSTSELVQIIANKLNKKRLLFHIPYWILKIIDSLKPGFVDRLFGSLQLDNSYTNQTLKFKQPYSHEEGISEMVLWYKKLKDISNSNT